MFKFLLSIPIIFYSLISHAVEPLKYTYLVNCWPIKAAFTYLVAEMKENMTIMGITPDGHVISIWENRDNGTFTISLSRTKEQACIIGVATNSEYSIIPRKRLIYGGQ